MFELLVPARPVQLERLGGNRKTYDLATVLEPATAPLGESSGEALQPPGLPALQRAIADRVVADQHLAERFASPLFSAGHEVTRPSAAASHR
jgi:hypothetical protein